MTPFCDYLNLTVPDAESGGLREALGLLLAGHGVREAFDRGHIYRLMEGTVRLGRRGQVLTIGVSGSAITVLRAAGLWGDLLSLFSEWPHRVTSLDVAYDRFDQAGADIVPGLNVLGKGGGVSLTRKGVDPRRVRMVDGLDPDGRLTGTVYLGARSAEVRCRVYDKRAERVDRGYSDPGNCVRYELTATSKVGISLRDAWDPAALFWHYMGRSLLESPPEVPSWVPAGEGFTMPKRTPIEPYQALLRHIEVSPELDYLLELSEACGPAGYSILEKALRSKREARESPSLGFSARAS